ncbi:hypothetical protein KL86SPO_40033 [uncultured Sporomusa sp.]|uniref:Uncharacterized protein n=1 Tax=uncultured Sporomusa sp. TaxID=307249 RepID=A0A212LVU9_9FIRM|nr:hypothetical protein KL86SPO_40033 [uncultured Sporomusa sp.]
MLNSLLVLDQEFYLVYAVESSRLLWPGVSYWCHREQIVRSQVQTIGNQW